jgi:hypothetical protein
MGEGGDERVARTRAGVPGSKNGMPPERRYEVEPGPEVQKKIDDDNVNVDKLVNEAVKYLNEPDEGVDDMAVARMFIERGISEEVAYWLVREAEVRRAPR